MIKTITVKVKGNEIEVEQMIAIIKSMQDVEVQDVEVEIVSTRKFYKNYACRY